MTYFYIHNPLTDHSLPLAMYVNDIHKTGSTYGAITPQKIQATFVYFLCTSAL